MKEKWKKIKGFKFYEVSSFGNVRSLDRYVTQKSSLGYKFKRLYRGKILKQTSHRDGYITTDLSSRGITRRYLIHRLVAEAFIKNPDNKNFVNHIDGNKENNVFTNLDWCTHQENMNHAVVNNLLSPKRKLTFSQVIDIKRRIINKELPSDIANIYNVSRETINDIKSGRTWRSNGIGLSSLKASPPGQTNNHTTTIYYYF